MDGDDTGTGDWGRRLRAHRLRAGLTQEDLARVSGISVRGIRLVENGKRRPRTATVTVLADSLRLSPGERTALMEAVWPEARSAAKPEPVVPRQLPPPPHGFAARESEIAWLDSILSREQGRLGCVTGTGGIGKTWLAVHWANRRAERFPDGQLYLNLRGFDPVAEPVSTRSALRSLLVALGTPAAALPSEVEDLAALFRGATAGRRVLLLLDNARDAAQVAPLLPGGADCLTIVTSRDSLRGLDIDHGAGLQRLESLADTAAAEVLARRLGAERMDREPAAAAAVVAACAGLPLALGIVAAQASRYPDHPLSALAEELELLVPGDDGEVPQRLGQLVDDSLRRLSPPAARLFWLLGLAPGDGVDGYAAASLVGQPVARVRRTLRDLDDAHLVEQDTPGHFRMHDLTFEYAAAHVDRVLAASDRDAASHRLADHYVLTGYAASRALGRPFDPPDDFSVMAGSLGTPIEDWEAAQDWLRTAEPVLLRLQALALSRGRHETAWRLADSVRLFVHADAIDPEVHRTLWRHAVEAAGELPPWQLVRAHKLLGSGLLKSGDHAGAIEQLQEALRLVSAHDVAGERANTHYTMAHVLQTSKRHEAALEHVQACHRAWDVTDRPSAYFRGHLLTCWILGDLGRHEDARVEGETALAIARDNGLGYMEAMALNLLGANERKAGDLVAAADLLRRADELHRHRGEHSNWVEINLDDLGEVLRAQGREAEAAAAWERSACLSEAAHRYSAARRVRAKIADMGRPG